MLLRTYHNPNIQIKGGIYILKYPFYIRFSKKVLYLKTAIVKSIGAIVKSIGLKDEETIKTRLYQINGDGRATQMSYKRLFLWILCAEMP